MEETQALLRRRTTDGDGNGDGEMIQEEDKEHRGPPSPSPPVVNVEIYVQGRAPPRHSFTAKLGGWDHNRLDLRSIMDSYNLRSLYAFSLSSGRGNRLLYNPKNGLSLVAYSGKNQALICLDADVNGSVWWSFAKVLLGALAIGISIVFMLQDSQSYWFNEFLNSGGRHVPWVLCLVVMLYAQLFSRPRKLQQKVREFIGKS